MGDMGPVGGIGDDGEKVRYDISEVSQKVSEL